MRKAALLLLTSIAVFGSQPWKSDPTGWSEQDVQRVLQDSPWAQSAGASFSLAEDNPTPARGPLPGPAEAGMAGPRGATDGRWDGGVGRPDRNGPPTLNVTIRWESALPVRQALAQEHSAVRFTEQQLQRDYIVSVLGLVPAGRYGHSELNSRSGDTSADPRNPEELLEGVMRYSRLFPKGKSPLRPDDVKLDEPSGTLYLFFPRSAPLDLDDKEAIFQTRFGSLSIVKRFRLKDMIYKGRLEL